MPVRRVPRAAVPAFPSKPTVLHAALAALLLAGGLASSQQARAAGAWWSAQGAARESVSGAAGLNAARAKRAQAASMQSTSQRQAAAQTGRMVANAGRTAQAIAAEMARQQRERDKELAAISSIPDGVALGGLQQDLAAGWQGADQTLRTRQEQGRTEVAIKQNEDKAILNWKTFNVGKNTTVRFDQSAGTDAKTGRNEWVVLNRITDPSGRPSEIAGQIKAEGGVYLINRNGVVFTGSSQINTRSLVASSLKLTDEQFKAGLNVRLGANTGDPGYWSGLEIAVGIPTFGENPTTMPADSSVLFDDMGPAFDPGTAPGDVKVLAGARIDAQGGHVLMFAPKVSNAGSIRTPEGQTLLAAGENVWLEAKGSSPTVRGFDAVASSVRPWAFPARFLLNPRTGPGFDQYLIGRIVSDIVPLMERRAAEVGYSVENTGIVQADHGDITLVSREIDQNGVLQASTALNNRAGSIRLRAWGQGVYNIDNNVDPSATHLVSWSGGKLTVGPDSITQVVNDWRDTTQIESGALANRYQPGRIELYGKTIDVQARAQVTAAAGNIDIQAQANPAAEPRHMQFGDGSRILIGADATISTAGLLEMPVDMAANFVEAELRINELRDSHLQAGTWLYGRKVIVDRRKSGVFDGLMAGVEWVSDDSGKVVKGAWVGTPLADVTGWVGNGLVTLSELAARGGNITIQSNGSMITRPGSILDVSGGSVRYSDGWNTETQLRGADGRVYSMSSAPADMTYVGIAGQYQHTHARWDVTRTYVNPLWPRRRWEQGYVEGREAGSLEIIAGSAYILEGEIKGSVQPGDRAQEQSDLPRAGRLTIGSNRAQEGLWTLGQVIISNTPTLLPGDFTIDSPLGRDAFLAGPEGQSAGTPAGAGRTTWLSASALGDSGLGSIELNLTAGFTLEEGVVLNLAPGSRFAAQVYEGAGNPGNFDIQGHLIAPGGNIVLSAGGVADSVLRLGANSVLSTAGQWVNDAAGGGVTLGRAIHGGGIMLGTPVKEGLGTVYGKVDVAAGAVLDVSGGGWLPDAASAGGGSRGVRAGNGGIISLMAFDNAALGTLDLRGWSGGDASRLSLMATGDVQVGGAASEAGAAPGAVQTLHLPEALYSDRGFGTIGIRSLGGDIVVAEGAQVRILPKVWDMSAPQALRALPSDDSLGRVLTPLALDELDGRARAARAPGGLSLSTGASGGSIRIEAGSLIQVDPGGSVSLDADGSGTASVAGRILAPAGTLDIRAKTALTLADGAELLLPGVAQIFHDPATNLHRGQVLAGGTVSLTAGSLDARAGSLIDVSGARGTVEHWARGATALDRTRRTAQEVGSDGGAVAITVEGGGAINATLRAHGGNAQAAGGSLSIMDTSSAGSPSGDLVNPDVGSFLFYRTPAGMTGTHTFDGIQYTRVIGTSANLDVFDEYAGDVRMASAMRTAINSSLPTLVSGSSGLVIDAGAALAPGAGAGIAPWEYNTAIDQRVVDLLNKHFWSGTGTALSHKISIGNIATADSTLHVASATLQNTGISTLELHSAKVGIQVSSGVDLNVDGRLRITAPVIRSDGKGGVARLHANALQLKPLPGTVGSAAGNVGELILSASQVLDIAGSSVKGDASQALNVSVRGFERTLLETGDLRFVAEAYGEGNADYDDANLRATLDVDGAVEIKAAQVYPATAVTARIRSDQSITVRGNGSAATPLSAGGSLTLTAPIIEQAGVLRAPFGQIVLDASERLLLGDASLTSVSGAGLGVLYGTLRNAEYWLDPANPQGRNRANLNDGSVLDENRYLSSLPEKRVSLQAPDVSMAAGAVVDIAGGGDLYAWEHVPGSGGSHDVLTLPGMYAVLPRYHGLSPDMRGAGDAAGREVWLAGGGLDAGWYTLLPAHYALLPGAFAVQATGRVLPAGAASRGQVATLRDGSVIVAGRVQDTISGAREATASAWRVSSGDLVRKVSEYNEAQANAFFGSDAFKLTQYRLTGQDVVTPRLPRDGGAVVFKATNTLALDGQLRSHPDQGGRGSLVDISADRIAIVGAGQDGSDLHADGYLIVDAGSLTRFGAGSLLVGGTRTGDARGLQVDVAASDVVLRNTADSVLSGPEVILAATNLVSIESGSVLRAHGQASGEDADLVLKPQVAAEWNDNNTPNDTSDDSITTPSRDWGALVRVGSGRAVSALRENVDTTTGGQVRIGAGALLEGGAALLIDATNTTEMAAGAQLSGTALSVAAGRIGIGGGSAGLALDAAALAQLSRTQALTLHSYSSLDFHRALDMRGLAQVVFDAAALQGAGADAVQVRAARLTLQNTGAQAVGVGTGSGRLELMADELVLGAGDKSISGFGQVLLSASQRIVGEGSGALDAGTAALTLSAPVLQGRAGADQAVRTQDGLVLQKTADMDAAALAELGKLALGARLSLAGQGVTVGLPVLALGGSITVDAGTGDLTVTDQGSLLAGGLEKVFFDVPQYVDAGQISLATRGGLIDLAPGSVLDLSAHKDGGNAGSLTVDASAGGRVQFGGALQARAGAGTDGGRFALAIDRLADFGGLAQTLNEAGFNQSWQLRIRQGDLTIAGATRVSDFEVITDRGVITVDGTAHVEASAVYGGSIRLVGGGGLVMQSGAVLAAHATDAIDGLGSSRITLEAVDGNLHLAGGTLDLSGGEGGRLRVRAQRNAGNDGLNVTALDAVVQGARSTVLEGARSYASADGTVESVKAAAIGEANAFAGNTGILAGLGGNAAAYTLAAGIEITSAGNLTLGSDWNLNADFGATHREGTLTLRAARNLNIDGHLSDGFDAVDRGGRLAAAPSWNLRLVSGADLASVDALAVQATGALAADAGTIRVGTANVTPGSGGAGKLVRTGTGDLTVRAGRDVVLAHKESVLYTAGSAEANPTLGGGFSTASVDAQYGADGGHVDIAAQGSVQAPTAQGSRSDHILTEWLFRQGRYGGDLENPTGYYDAYNVGNSWDVPPNMSARGQQPSWWVNYATFQQGLGALGGGNVRLSAGGDLVNLVVALPSTMRVTGGRSADDAAPAIVIRNGGQLQVKAGGTLKAGQYYVGRGAGQIEAGASAVGYALTGTSSTWPFSAYRYDIAPVLALSDATLTLKTYGDLVLQTVIDPMEIRRAYFDQADRDVSGASSHGLFMSSFTERSALKLVSTGGNVRLENQSEYVAGNDTANTTQLVSGVTDTKLQTDRLGLYPAKVSVSALGGSIDVGGLLAMAPAATSDLSLLAAQDLHFLRGGSLLNTGAIVMVQTTLDKWPSILTSWTGLTTMLSGGSAFGTPLKGAHVSNTFLTNMLNGGIYDNPDALPMQAHDFAPSRLYAASGSITDLNLIASESVRVQAGTDIRNFELSGRNLRATDTTLLAAGNDILAVENRPLSHVYATYGGSAESYYYDRGSRAALQGPGELLLLAGRDIQGNNLSLYSNANRYWDYVPALPRVFEPNVIKALPDEGADITLMAGMNAAPSYGAFEQAYLNPANVAAMPGYLKTTLTDGTTVPLYLVDGVEARGDLNKLARRGLVSFVEGMLGAGRVASLTGSEDGKLTPQQAWDQYQQLPALARQQFLRQIFMYELREGGRDQNDVNAQGQSSNGGYRRGYAAIDTLFRGTAAADQPVRYAQDLPDDWRSAWTGAGDIAFTRLAARTHQGGDVNVFTPGGGLQAAALGAAVPNGYGLVTLASPGQINVFADRDIVVNRSRILSFVSQAEPLGSDQVLWSTRGDIDAGRGAKTVRVPQAPEVTADQDGNITVREKRDMSGAGIGTVGEGDVDLVAPGGTVNAGDAGIRVAGNFNVAALRVLNASNIQVEGESKGVPVAASVNTGALTSASAAASNAATAAQESVSRARDKSRQALPSIVTVQILGFGTDGAAAPPSAPTRGPAPTGQPVSYRPESAIQVLGDGELPPAQQARLDAAAQRGGR